MIQIGWGTSDNASTNDRAMAVLQRVLDDPNGRRWNAKECRGRCMEHTVHLGAKSFIESICPTPARFHPTAHTSTSANHHTTVEEVEDEDEDFLDDWLIQDSTAAADGEEVDDPVDFEPGDLLGKVLAMVNQVGGLRIILKPELICLGFGLLLKQRLIFSKSVRKRRLLH